MNNGQGTAVRRKFIVYSQSHENDWVQQSYQHDSKFSEGAEFFDHKDNLTCRRRNAISNKQGF